MMTVSHVNCVLLTTDQDTLATPAEALARSTLDLRHVSRPALLGRLRRASEIT
jgi:hypothetical protein